MSALHFGGHNNNSSSTRCFRPRRAVSGPEFRGTTRVVTRLKNGMPTYPDYHRKSMTILKSMPIFGATWKSMPILSPKSMPKMPFHARFQGENLGKTVPTH